MSATKDQERKALEKIRKIVEDLGEDSYIGMAFEGCFEIAEENIESDFGLSMKQRWESESEHVDLLLKENQELKRRCEKLEAQIGDYEKQSIFSNDRLMIANLIQEKMNELDVMAKKAAEKIIEYADNPLCHEFKEAVKSHRNVKASYDSYGHLWQTIVDTLQKKKSNPDMEERRQKGEQNEKSYHVSRMEL